MTERPESFVATGGLRVDSLASTEAVAGLYDEWLELYDRSDTVNPYCHPAWSCAALDDGLLPCVLTVRAHDRLVAVAPLEQIRQGMGVASVSRLGVLGFHRHAPLFELPQCLVAPGYGRPSMRAVTEFVCRRRHEWDWWRASLGAGAGWFEPSWTPAVTSIDDGVLVLDGPVRATVVVALQGAKGAPPQRPGSRNLRESLRRGRNRLEKTFGQAWSMDVVQAPSDVVEAASTVLALHSARAGLAGHKAHDDYGGVAESDFFLKVVRRLRAGEVVVHLLSVPGGSDHAGGRDVLAGLVTLAAPRATHCSVSGVSSTGWQYSGVTLLQERALRYAAELGHRQFSLASGPDQAKLRWSNDLDYYPDFFVIRDRRRSRAAFALYRYASAVGELTRERERRRAR